MAHYQCSNCGAYEGIDFGICKTCTPKEYFELQDDLNGIKWSAKREWNDIMAIQKESFMDQYKKEERENIEKQMKELEVKHKGRRL